MIAPPTRLVLETSAVCNLHCPQCWIGLRWTNRGANHFMSLELFDRIMEEAQDFIQMTYLHLWGEPTLNKHLPEMIDGAKSIGAVDVTTHGLFIDEELADAISVCDQIGVSIDGVTQEVYEQYRVGGKLEHAMRGLKLLHERAGARCRWVFVVFQSNEHQIPTAQQLADELGIQIEFKAPAFWDRTKMTASMPTEEKYRRFIYRDGDWHLKADRLQCREFWTTAYVLPNGDMVTCCHDGGAEYLMGNVNESSLLEVWNGEKYQAMRDSHQSGKLNEMCLKYCQLAA